MPLFTVAVSVAKIQKWLEGIRDEGCIRRFVTVPGHPATPQKGSTPTLWCCFGGEDVCLFKGTQTSKLWAPEVNNWCQRFLKPRVREGWRAEKTSPIKVPKGAVQPKDILLRCLCLRKTKREVQRCFFTFTSCYSIPLPSCEMFTNKSNT